MPDIALGLITHGRSRFHEDARDQLERLHHALGALGLSVTSSVSDRDDYDPVARPIDAATVQRAAIYQADLEFRWRRYLVDSGARGRSALGDRLVRRVMRRRRLARLQPADLIRLLNIDLSHLRVMTAGIESGAPWTLALEDDARVDDVETAARQIAGILEVSAEHGAAMVNLSESIGVQRLGVEGLLDTPVADVEGVAVVPARVPLTNTVCAVLYGRDPLVLLRDRIEEAGLDPVVPIDWRVNDVILDSPALLAPCLWAVPGVFRQGSMHG
jgi:hypothetical protein